MNYKTIPIDRKEIISGFIYWVLHIFLSQPLLSYIGNMFSLRIAEINFLYFAINFLCTTVLFHQLLINSVKAFAEIPFYCLRCAGIGFLLYWVSSFLLGIILMRFFPDFYNVNDSSITEMLQENTELMTVGTVILVPVAEELIYRGLIFGSLYSHNRFLAYFISAVIFSAIHIVSYIGTYPLLHLILCLLQYLPAGILLAWSYARSGSILTPILLHATINQIAIISTR